MPHVRSVSIGVWLTRGSRHEPAAHEGIAHFVEHMLFKGTATALGRGHRAAGRLDRRPPRRLHLEGIRRLLHQGARRAPAARRRRAVGSGHRARCSTPPKSSARRRSCSKRSRWSRTRPTISFTRSSPASFWPGHPLGRPDSRPARHGRRRSTAPTLRAYFADAYVAQNFVVAAVGNIEHAPRARPRRARVRAVRRHGARRCATRRPPLLPSQSCAPRTSSRATCVWARPASSTAMPTATSPWRSTPCSAAR